VAKEERKEGREGKEERLEGERKRRKDARKLGRKRVTKEERRH
jgi:hypothetical protein